MPIEIDDTYIIINDGSTTSNILEVVKSRLTTQGDEIANEPTITNEQLYRSQPIPATQYNYPNVYPSLDADTTNLILQWKFDDPNYLFYDSITKANIQVNYFNGTTPMTTSDGVVGSGLNLETTTQDVDYDIPTSLINLSTTSHSFTTWIKLDSGGETYGRMFVLYNNLYLFMGRSAGTSRIHIYSPLVPTTYYKDDSLQHNIWYHIAVVVDVSALTLDTYINGIKSSDFSFTNIGTSSLAQLISIGQSSGSTTRDGDGQIEDFRIYDKALTPSEIDILANLKVKTYVEPMPLLRLMENDKPKYKLLTFTYDNNLVDYPILDVDSTNLVAWFKFDGDLTNSIANSITATSGGSNDVTFNESKINGTSSAEAHTNKFIKLNNFNPYNIWSSGSGISFAMWVKMDNLSSYVYGNRNQRIFSIASVANSGDTTSPNRTHQLGIWRTDYEPTRTLNFYHNNGTSVESYQTSAFLRDSTWFHLIWSIDSNGDWGIYIDGIDQYVNITLSLNNNPHELVFIGGDIANLNGSAYSTYFDDFRVYDKALSQAEITDLYNQYFQAKYQLNFSNDAECDILIVGGGGGGGGKWSGGGGGGDVKIHNSVTLNGTYDIIVGNGGHGSGSDGGQGSSGFNSLIYKNGNLVYGAAGGGGGKGRTGYATAVPTIPTVTIGGVVVSEGGGGGGNPNAGDEDGIVGIYGFSGNGGVATTSWQAGGGGGSGGDGIQGNIPSNEVATKGGPGTSSDMTGITLYYGGGGGGGDWTSSVTNPSYGQHGGGRGREGVSPELPATDGEPNTGGGGGGGGINDAADIGTNGGSGIVMIRYKLNYGENQHDAQWTYSSSDASVYHLGNVGIGTEASSTHSLNVAGDVNVNGDIFIDDAKISTSTHITYVHDNDPVVYNDNIRTLPVYDNRTDSLQKAAEEVSGVKGWRLVRFLPGNATTWHPVNDSLVGTTTYGTAYDYTNAFSVEFGEFDQFMFSNGNMRNWLYATRDQVIGQSYDNAQRTIIKSSISNTSYKARWYNRSSSIDPLISIEDWSVSSTGDKHGILYIEDSYTSHKEYFSNSGGMCVFVRNSTDTISSVATDYTHKYMMFTYNNYYESTFSYYTVHNINFPVDTQCDVLVVGGGGSGGPDQGGGGGAGGLVYLQNVTLNGNYSLVVGKGGAQTPYASNANNGYSSYFNKSRLSTYEDDNLEDYANGTIYGELNDISNNTYFITLSNGIETRLTGWTHTRTYASGFLRNTSGYAYLTAFNLISGETYDFATYSNNTTSSEHRDSYFNVNGGSTITVKQRQTKQPTYVGHAVADSNGEIIFKFWRSAGHIQFSGISISLNEGKYTAIYGGGGGRYSTSTSTYHGLDGGSGGGGANGHSSGITATGGDSIQEEYLDSEGNRRGWGNPGGQGLLNSYSGNYVSAGGGGAGAAGEDVISNATAGNGGDGKEVGITGVMTYYAGGGGGGNGSNSGAYGGEGGLGGGGHGGQTQNLYVASSTINKYKDGLPHTGSGGGGVRNGATNSGAGGSGVVIIKYAVGNRINTLSSWKYNSQFDDVYLMGNVGINNKSPTDALAVDGDIVATSKSFKIEHPIVSNIYLYHACIEGPRYDNIYRGKKLVVDGYCEVDIDTECNSTGGMTPGTFVALNDDYQLYLQNNQTFDKVRGYIENGKIKVYCLNTTENIMVDWLVIGERRDKDVIKSSLTNAKGKLICEH